MEFAIPNLRNFLRFRRMQIFFIYLPMVICDVTLLGKGGPGVVSF